MISLHNILQMTFTKVGNRLVAERRQGGMCMREKYAQDGGRYGYKRTIGGIPIVMRLFCIMTGCWVHE